MNDELWKRDEIESPCVKICVIHPEARMCVGCFRTPEEISGWSRMTPERRREIMAALPERGKTLTKRRGGRASRIAQAREPGSKTPEVIFAPKSE